MRKLGFYMVLLAGMAAFGPAIAAPFDLNYSGRLTHADGSPVAGPVDLTVKFFDAPTNGILLLTKTVTDAALVQGQFNVPLTLSDVERQTVFDGTADTWIQVSTADATYPRQKFLAVPYALKVPVDDEVFKYDANGNLTLKVDLVPDRVLGTDLSGDLRWIDLSGSGTGDMLSGTWDSNGNSKVDQADLAVNATDAADAALLDGQPASFYLDAANIPENATRKWLTNTERTKLSGIATGADMLSSLYDGDDDGKVNSAVAADTATTAANATQLGGQAASYYLDADHIGAGTLAEARIHSSIARDSELPTAASIATGFAADAVSGDKVHGGTISDFASTGIDDNAAATAMTIDATGKVGIGTPSPDVMLDVVGTAQIGPSASGLRIYNGTTAGSVAGSWASVNVGNQTAGHGSMKLQYMDQAAAANPQGRISFQPRNNADTAAVASGDLEFTKLAGEDSAYMSINLMNAGTTSERLRLSKNGNLSVGTSTTDYRLTVSGSALATGYFSSSHAEGAALVLDSSGTQNWYLGVGGTTDSANFPLDDFVIHQAGATSRLIIDTSGNVGIGAAPTTSKLAVAGTIESTAGGIKFPDASVQTTATPTMAAARVQRATTGQSIPNNTDTCISFNSEVSDTGGFWVVGSPTRFSIPATGTYLLGGGVNWASDSTGVRELFITHNGSANIVIDKRTAVGSSNSSVTTLRNMTAGDYVELCVNQTSGASLVVDAATSTHFWITRIN